MTATGVVVDAWHWFFMGLSALSLIIAFASEIDNRSLMKDRAKLRNELRALQRQILKLKSPDQLAKEILQKIDGRK